jgi:lysine-ketoglutarate reductase/saccharopine dehydrogenase-like protein (TIGR00300 family)
MVREVVTLEGHIIDSRVLGTVLDDVLGQGGKFKILEVHIGTTRDERSHARIEIAAEDLEKMHKLLEVVSKHGAIWHAADDALLSPADQHGAFPEGFCSSTNQQTFIRHGGQWIEVRDQEMDCGIVQDTSSGTFSCLPVTKVQKGQLVVMGEQGVKVVPFERHRAGGVFEFMNSEVSTEKPKHTIIRNCAMQMHAARQEGKKLLLVGGPAIVHTGAAEHVVHLIEHGYIHVLFAGNALATHDIELALYGTSLGVYLDRATLSEGGHSHHIRAINTIRRSGSIAAAVEQGVLTSGIMHACIKHDVKTVLAASIRDDGPLPDVITDAMVAQDRMRDLVKEVGFALMVATGLHSIATGNLLPAWIPAVCVDISPSILTKLSDRGSFQTVGLVTDVEPFFRSLVSALDEIERG